MPSHKILMIPGPTEVHPDVLKELGKPPIAHYGSDWMKIYEPILRDLKKIFATKYQTLLFPGTGSLCLEMAAINLLEHGDNVVACSNGYFGSAMVEALRLHGIRITIVRARPGKAIDADKVRRAAKRLGKVKAVFLVHNETSTGVLNPLKEVGEVAEEIGSLFVVDAISSFGGIDIQMDRYRVDYCVGYSSKCLGAVNGVVPLALNDRAWDAVDSRKSVIKGRLINLRIWRRFIEEWTSVGHPFPCTLPASIILGLRKAMDLAFKEGLSNRYKRHILASKALREGAKVIGLKPIASDAEASPTVTALAVPDGTDHVIRKSLYDKYNIMVGGGIEELRGKIIRVGHMSLIASPSYILHLLEALGEILNGLGHVSDPTLGVERAKQVFAEK